MGNALGFNATGDYLGRTTNLLNFNASYTVTLWAYFDSFSDYAHFWGATVDTIDQSGKYVNSDMFGGDNANPANSRIGVCNSGSGGGIDFQTGSVFATGTWVFLALRRTGNNLLVLFINGSSTAAITSTQSVSSRGSVGGEWLGRLNGAYNINGRIANVKQWSAALTTGEIAAEKDVSTAVRTSNLHEVLTFPTGGSKLVGSINGYTWTSNGTITDEAGPPIDLAYDVSGSIGSEASISSTVAVDYVITGSTSGKVLTAATVNQDITLSGSTSGKSDLSSSVSIGTEFSSTVTVKSATSSSVEIGTVFTGSVFGKVDSSASVNQDFLISGNTTGKVGLSHALEDDETSVEFDSTIEVYAELSSTVSVDYVINGSISCKSDATATVSNGFVIGGSMSAKVDATGTISVGYEIAGAAAAKASVSSSPFVEYNIGGTIEAVAATSASASIGYTISGSTSAKVDSSSQYLVPWYINGSVSAVVALSYDMAGNDEEIFIFEFITPIKRKSTHRTKLIRQKSYTTKLRYDNED